MRGICVSCGGRTNMGHSVCNKCLTAPWHPARPERPERTQPRIWPSCRIWVRECDQCGELFTARRWQARTCSPECRRRRNNRLGSDRIIRLYRSDPDFRAQWLTKGHNRRASKLGAGSITSPADLIAYLMVRDRGRCRVEDCLFADRRVRAKTGPGKPSIDHIVPLSLGGEHSLENVQLAHYRCNLSKHNRIRAVQPLLVG